MCRAHCVLIMSNQRPRRQSPGGQLFNRISNDNFLILFHTNYGSILLSFRDMAKILKIPMDPSWRTREWLPSVLILRGL